MKVKVISLFIVLLAILFASTYLEAASSGPNSAGTGANDNSYAGAVAWTNASNITASDDARATGTTSSGDVDTQYLKGTNFGFSIPAGATINGIIVEIEKSYSGTGTINDSRVRIVKADASIGTTDKADTVTNWSSSDAYATYGSSSDLWGETWTYSDINDSDFGAVIAARLQNNDVNVTARVDHIRITVHYTEATAVNPNSSLQVGSGTLEIGSGRLDITN